MMHESPLDIVFRRTAVLYEFPGMHGSESRQATCPTSDSIRFWDRPFGTARENGPFGIPSRLPIEIGTPNNGGSVVTASGLIFIAAATDKLIRAIDIETGETIWKDVLPAGGQANPMIYEMDGREYLVIMAGGHHFMMTPRGNYVIAYALPQS